MTHSRFPITLGTLAAACLLLSSAHAATTVTYFDESGTGSPFSSSFHPGMPEMIFPGPPILVPGPPIFVPGPDIVTPGPDIPGPDGFPIPGPDIVVPGPPILVPGPDIMMPGPDITIPAIPSSASLQGLVGAVFARTSDDVSFSQGTDLNYTGSVGSVTFSIGGAAQPGVSFAPDSAFNLIGVSLDGDGIFESVARFSLGSNGESRLLAIVSNDDNTPLSISQGYAMLVPEPSACGLSALALATLLLRRRR
jgi:hypothetical protein